MTLLFVDTETSHLINKRLALSDPGQPWCVSIAAELTDNEGNPLDFFKHRIRADGRKIGDGAAAIHGMTSRDASRSGVPEIVVLGALVNMAGQARRCIGHGIKFDCDVVTGVLIRRGKDARQWTRPGLEFVDTISASTQFCQLPPPEKRDDGGFKWPSLDQATSILLNEPPREGAHDAWADLHRMKRLYFELLRRNAIEPVSDV